jgi:hypothetical protein
MGLASKRIAKLKKPGRYRDPESRGLYLHVGRTGTKSWLFRFELNGRERFMGLGADFFVGAAVRHGANVRVMCLNLLYLIAPAVGGAGRLSKVIPLFESAASRDHSRRFRQGRSILNSGDRRPVPAALPPVLPAVRAPSPQCP